MGCKKIITVLFFIAVIPLNGQHLVSGVIIDGVSSQQLEFVEVFDKEKGLLTKSDNHGKFSFKTSKDSLVCVFFLPSYQLYQKTFYFKTNSSIELEVRLNPLSETIDPVEIKAYQAKAFALRRLKDVEGMMINHGKKTEVVLMGKKQAALATNCARQIYNQVGGLNIYQNDDAGLQLNIGGRGLDPNRTANFNTRQNGYDISADVLGYPESYYTPASEALEEIQFIRGAASLQYGTQFGGLINFKLKKPRQDKVLELISRNSLGSNGLYTNFTSLSGTKDKLGYYSYFNYKRGDGFRDNSSFDSKNAYLYFDYQLGLNTKISSEFTYLNYLAKQAGGLTDQMFNDNPYQSNRSRNWFSVNWLLANVRLLHKFSNNSRLSLGIFTLDATRDALGFRTNRVDQPDDLTKERDLIKGTFKNWGSELRFLHNYKLLSKDMTLLIGTKYYRSNNQSKQGPGSVSDQADFDLQTLLYPNYQNQSSYQFPNQNIAVFSEQIVYLSDQFSFTPGIRFEHINTQSEGSFKKINLDTAGNVIHNETLRDQRHFKRSFVLMGVGLSYKPVKPLELYANFSENYRSVTFSDIQIVNPAFSIDPNITDESGYSADIGIRGKLKKFLLYDLGAFGMFYQDRIGFVQIVDQSRVISQRTNVGDTRMLGVDCLVEIDLKKWFKEMSSNYNLSWFVNSSAIQAIYTASAQDGIVGNSVEFVPKINCKSGFNFSYRSVSSSLQYTYLSSQFTDATNSTETYLSGVVGQIPAYSVMDFSIGWQYKRFRLDSGVNNLLNTKYFTRRATGYPGPGIIPSAPLNWYVTLEIKI